MKSRELRVFFFVFTASGFAGLIYELIWIHYLKLFLGHDAYAQVVVLAVFMGGMALGSLISSKYSGRLSNSLFGYVVVEAIIGLCAVFFHPMYVHFIDLAYSRIIPALSSTLAADVFEWAAATLLILPHSILLGMTFPLMATGLIRRFPTSHGTIVAMLYFTNSIGAAIGVLAAGFLFIGWVGLPGTLIIAAFINFMVAAVVWLENKKLPVGPPILQAIKTELPVKRPNIFYRIFLLIALMTGLSSFIYEIGWIRMLSFVLGSSTHAFELMLSAFITGLAFGSLWVKRRIDSIEDHRRFLALVQIVMGILAMATLPLYSGTFDIMAWLMKSLPKTDAGYLLFNLSSHGIALFVMIPAAFCAGMTLPLITTALLRNGFGERSIGAIYGFNTIGALLGVVISINFALPLLGLKGMIILGAGIDIALGLGLAWWSFPSSRIPALYTAAGVFAVLILTFGFDLDPNKMASGVYRFGVMFTDTKEDTIFHHDGKTATVSITKGQNILSIRTNGKTDAGVQITGVGHTTDEGTMQLLGLIGIVLHPESRTAAVIGWGSGLTTATLLADPRLDRVDTIEIEPEMIRAATLFGTRVHRAYDDPRSHIHIDDAKSYFSFYNKTYDLIISEPSNPWVSGVASLFTTEFYSRVRGYLDKNGLFVQWIQLHEFDMPLLASIMNALSSNFADYVIYSPNNVDIIIVASPDGIVGNPDKAALSMIDLNKELRHIDILGTQDIQARMLGNKKAFSPFFASYDVTTNSDYAPVVDLYSVRARYLGRAISKDILNLQQYNLPIIQMLGDYPSPDLNATNVTFSNYDKSLSIHYANLFLQFLSGGPWTWPHRGYILPDDALQNAIVARQVLTRECSNDTFIHEWWKAMIYPVAGLVVNSSPAQLNRLFGQLEKPLCSKYYSSSQHNFISLLKAVGKRDSVLMATLSEKLLVQIDSIPSDTPLREYILAAGILGNLSSGNREKASALWNQFGRLLSPNISKSLPIQFLLAHIDYRQNSMPNRRNVSLRE